MTMKMMSRAALLAATSVVALAGQLAAEDLDIAISGAFTTMDPHFYNATPNHTVAMHIFDRLIDRKPDTSLAPSLAESWEAVSDTEWLVKLRAGVKWHDGVDFTAEDVAFTYTRARDVPNSPGSFGGFLREVKSVEVIDPLTLKIITPAPAPNLPRNLAFVPIISKHVGETATTEDYNSGKAVIGTGPYKFVKYTPSDRVEYIRNEAYWGGAQPWEKLTLRMIPNAGARVAALLSGDVDVIDNPPAGDLERLAADPKLKVTGTEGMRLMYLTTKMGDEVPVSVTGTDGKNPLEDLRVREALSVAINREGLTSRVMRGAGEPTGQWLAKGQFGYSDNVAVPAFDTDRAKALLAEAGYPNGFALTLIGSNDRYPNDAATVQAIAQMWTRAGIKTAVDTQPWSSFSGVMEKGAFSVALQGWGSPTGEAGYLATNVLHTRISDKGLGIFNRSAYSNPEFDSLVVEAMATLDEDARRTKLETAVEMVTKDHGMIPLFMLRNNWATSAKVTIEPRRDERTLAMDVKPAE